MGKVLPILFNTDMVKAILEGRKMVTRRIVKPQMPDNCPACGMAGKEFIYDLRDKVVYCARCGEALYNGGFPYKAPYHPGDILYVRETWAFHANAEGGIIFKARCPDKLAKVKRWRPSIHMPKEAARIWLKVTDVRVKRLQNITEEQSVAEGAIDNRGFIHSPNNEYSNIHTAKDHFCKIWDSTIKKTDIDRYGWAANPWVWVIEFEWCQQPRVSKG